MKDTKSLTKATTTTSKVIALALVAGFLAACNGTGDNPDAVIVPEGTPAATPTVTPTITPTATPTPGATTTQEPINQVVIISGDPNQQGLVGRRVQLSNVSVQEVNGDRTFWVGTSPTERVFVVLAPGLDTGAAEQQVQIQSGQTLDVSGVLTQMPTPEQAQQQWQGLDATEAQALANQSVYLQADQVTWR